MMRTDFTLRSWLFGLLILLAVAAPGALSVASFNAYRDAAAAVTRAEHLRGEISRLDEVLTMSARLAATTGDARWIARYDANVGALERAIDDMLELSGSEAVAELVHETDAANTALVAMETRSFELVRRGREREAYALLVSPAYARQKAIYAEGMGSAMTSVQSTFAADTSRNWSRLLLTSLLSVIGVLFCFVTWVALLGKSFREHNRLHELAEAERDAAQAANAAKSMFLASMSHELRTPLNAVIGYSEMLREGAEEDERLTDIADHDRVIAAARRLLALIDDLLDLSKAEAGKVVLRPSQFDVRALVEGITATIAPAAASRGNRVRVEIAEGVERAVSDEFRLGQCLLNLLSNAAKFTKNGEISLSVVQSEDWLVFNVADTGIGMSPSQLDQLFQPFVQVESAVSQAHGGTGLGLAITRQLARMLGGDVTVNSVEGEGSTFTLKVAAAFESAGEREASQSLMAA